MREDTTAEQLGSKFSSLAEEVEAVLRRIRKREEKAEDLRKGDKYTPRPPYNIFKELPGRPDFEYIKVPKKPAELCFGSRTERKVYPDIPELLKRSTSCPTEINIKKLTSWKPHRRRKIIVQDQTT